MNYQRVILCGNATEDAQSKTSRSGDLPYATFSLAVRDTKNSTTFFPVVVFGKSSKAVARYVTKGRLVLVEGRLEAGEKKRFSIIADTVRFGPEPSGARSAE